MTLSKKDKTALWQLSRELEDTDLEGHMEWTVMMLDEMGSDGIAPTPWHDERNTRRATSELALEMLVESNQAIDTGYFYQCECSPIYVAPQHFEEWLDRLMDGDFEGAMPAGVNGVIMLLLEKGEIYWPGEFRHGKPVFIASSV